MQLLFNIFVLGVLCILLIIEQKRYSQLQKRVAEKRKELIALSHELRSPFIALKKYNSFFLKKEFGKLSLSQIEVLNRMERASSDVLVILNRVLAASRLEEGEIVTDVSQIDVCDAMNATLDSIGGLIRSRKHTVVRKYPSKKVVIKADPLLLHGVLDELVQNAAAYTPDQGVLTITIRQTNTEVTIDISDTGIGVNDQEKPYIFLKFFRGERALSMHDGHGLGLAFAQQFAKYLRGSVKLVRTSPRGTTFRVTLVRKR